MQKHCIFVLYLFTSRQYLPQRVQNTKYRQQDASDVFLGVLGHVGQCTGPTLVGRNSLHAEAGCQVSSEWFGCFGTGTKGKRSRIRIRDSAGWHLAKKPRYWRQREYTDRLRAAVQGHESIDDENSRSQTCRVT